MATTTGPAGFSVVASAPSARLQFVRFLNATTGILVARPEANATTWPLFRTDDGGATWVTSTTPTPVAGDYPLTCTQVGNTFWVSTYLGYVLRSTDEGRTWTSADTGLGTSLREVSFRSVLNGLAFGDAGQLRRTSDGGQNWIMVTPQGPLRLTKATAVEGSAGTYLSVAGEWNSAQNGTSISTDDGATWVEVESSINMQRLVSREGVVYGTGFPFGNNTTMTLYKYASPLSTRARQQERASFCFPNPTADVINLPAASETRTVRLYDAVGRLHRTWELDRAENVLHLDGVALGVYQLHLFEQNKAIRVQQIVVQR
ncbi:T9SS type A sorting domain-containing protein [Hymenobacter tibetensis]|uniref:T9SS type A sorting domain-containing protein n=1 Tax=Hymenobacter tibetensis TaxID=497967 RepID=A0ABY4D163_9BACT|nr:T9SS type A sorting domain-containing protein [Hymenobacter tibetensis]UOG76281.1 T9SS type A sorting domain-containing protein [Hymenobacter tibetensis]